MVSLRDKQIREILDEDLKSYKEVLNREFQQTKLMNQNYAPPSKLDRVSSLELVKLFEKLQHGIQAIIDKYIAGESVTSSDDVPTDYNLLTSLLARTADTNPLSQRDKAQVEGKFDTLEPLLNQLYDIALADNFTDKETINRIKTNVSDRAYFPVQLTSRSAELNNVLQTKRRDAGQIQQLIEYAEQLATNINITTKERELVKQIIKRLPVAKAFEYQTLIQNLQAIHDNLEEQDIKWEEYKNVLLRMGQAVANLPHTPKTQQWYDTIRHYQTHYFTNKKLFLNVLPEKYREIDELKDDIREYMASKKKQEIPRPNTSASHPGARAPSMLPDADILGGPAEEEEAFAGRPQVLNPVTKRLVFTNTAKGKAIMKQFYEQPVKYAAPVSPFGNVDYAEAGPAAPEEEEIFHESSPHPVAAPPPITPAPLSKTALKKVRRAKLKIIPAPVPAPALEEEVEGDGEAEDEMYGLPSGYKQGLYGGNDLHELMAHGGTTQFLEKLKAFPEKTKPLSFLKYRKLK